MPLRLQRFLPGIVALVTLIVFLPALRNDFVDWDDPSNIVNNLSYRGLGWTQLHWMWTTFLASHYIPITWMTLGLDYLIWGMNPLGYHLGNVLWHTMNAVLVYFLALALVGKAVPETSIEMRARIPLAALFAALLFAIHPLRVESVAWATERRDVVSGCFYLLAILVYIRGSSIGCKQYWGSLGLFLVAVLSKEIVVTLPLILVILDIYPLRRAATLARIVLEKIPFLAIAIAASILAVYIGRHDDAMAMIHLNWIERIAMSVYGLAFYLWKLVLPIGLAPFYEVTAHRVDPRGVPFLLSSAMVVAIAVLAFLLRRKFPALAAAALAYAIGLTPVLGIFKSGAQLVADRYSYLPCLGWMLLAGATLLVWKVDRTARIVPACVVIVALSALTWRQIGFWRDSEALWEHALATEPSFIAHFSYGDVLAKRGDYLWAVEHYRQAVAIKPDFAPGYLNLGLALASLGKTDEAIREFTILRSLNTMSDLAENNLGAAYGKEGKIDEAIRHYQEAVRLNPKSELARLNLQLAIARREAELEKTTAHRGNALK